MDNIKDDNYYLKKIVTDLQFLIEHTKGKSYKEVEADLVLIDSIMFRLIQIPNRNGNCVAGNWIDKYDLTEAQIDSVRSEEGIEIALAREGRTFTMFLNGIPVTDYTVNAEGADTAKVFPAFVFVDDSKQSARFFDYACTIKRVITKRNGRTRLQA